MHSQRKRYLEAENEFERFFLCRFPTVFGKYIKFMDQVSEIRRFHLSPFEFQELEKRPEICFLLFRILYCNVSVKSKLPHPPPPPTAPRQTPRQTPRHLTFLKIIVQIPPYPGQNAVQMPHTRVHSGDQCAHPGYISQAHK